MFHRHQLGCACCSPHLVATALGQGEHEWQDLLQELSRTEAHRAPEAVIFHGGRIYPDPEDTSKLVDALGIADHKVIAAGTLDDVRRRVREKHPDAREQGLTDGQTLLPGLIDPHMHILPSAVFQIAPWIDLSPFKDQKLRAPYDEAFIRERLDTAIATAKQSGEKWVGGIGVDPSLMSKWLNIDRDWLNNVSTDVCLFLVNASGHLAYANSPALQAAGLKDDASNSVLTESNLDAVMKCMPSPKPADLLRSIRDVLHDANMRGITTLFDAGLGMGMGYFEVIVMKALAKTPWMTVRLGAALFGNNDLWSMWLKHFTPQLDSAPEALFSIRAMKLIADGSNQGLTGLQRQPYTCHREHSVPKVGPNGLFNFDPIESLAKIMQEVVAAKWPIMTHANGDEAISNVLAAYQLVLSKVPPAPSVPPQPAPPQVELRHRIEHASLLSDDDLRTMKRLSVSPSFLIGHVGYWGRTFQKTILGEERAQKLDRCKSALREGLRISLHSDRFVSPLGPLRYMEQAIGRVMEADPERAVLNEAECLSPAEALRAVTIDAAWQCHLDDQIGSLKEGKQADLVILEQDPLQIALSNPDQLRDIKVKETWVSGRKVYDVSTR